MKNICKVNIKNEQEILALMEKGLKVGGRLWMETGADGERCICFARYNRKAGKRNPARLVCYLEHGWVKESVERIKVYESIPKILGAAGVGHVLKRETKSAADALIDCELDGIIF
jgi:hypothetical protein